MLAKSTLRDGNKKNNNIMLILTSRVQESYNSILLFFLLAVPMMKSLVHQKKKFEWLLVCMYVYFISRLS